MIAIGLLRSWMEEAGMSVTVDGAGNLRGFYPGTVAGAPTFVIGSHLDTVPDAGAFDGVLGVAIAISLVHLLKGRRLRFGLEVVGFSEEEGVRFGIPFIGSKAWLGRLHEDLLGVTDKVGISLAEAIRRFGLDPPDANVRRIWKQGQVSWNFTLSRVLFLIHWVCLSA